ncbi:AAA family ATPase [Hahella sp. SMD15-11]|uniref:AAA family ATPase n=1 Tax=Thermohahella caldifontis TaxID=3142973 RepID=A0AB39UVP0_9GAMM
MNNTLIRALENPAVYPHPAEAVQRVETHISWVLLTGTHAYKIKKPMDFGFLNFTTLEARRYYCEEEVRLNRRTAPELYECIVSFCGTPESPVIHEGIRDDAFEYGIRMKQFRPDEVLDEVPIDHPDMPRWMDELADTLAALHASASVADGSVSFGDPDEVWAPVQQNFEQISPLLQDDQERRRLENIAAWARDTFERLAPLMAGRKARGFVRECHGDVHLGNVACVDNHIRLFDCIEFNESFRWTDTWCDLAFLLMDLEDRGRDDLASRVLNRYLEQTGDYEGLQLLAFYKSYRAMVRCKIALLTLANPELGPDSRRELEVRYTNYIELAERYMQLPKRFCIAMCGLSGSGKSTVSGELLETMHAIRIRSDVERKRLFGLSPRDNSQAAGKNIYTPEATQRTYDRVAELAGQVLDCGYPVIADATYLRRAERATIEQVAEDRAVPFVLVRCTAPEALIEKWLTERKARGEDPAEADVDVFRKQKTAMEALSEEENRHCLSVDTQDLKAIHVLAERLGVQFG